jgi:hypothetical protein
MPRTQTPAPLTSPSYWRRLMATVHPDRDGGDHELFVFLTALREYVQEGIGNHEPALQSSRQRESSATGSTDRIPFDEQLGYVDEFVTLTMRALSVGRRTIMGTGGGGTG